MHDSACATAQPAACDSTQKPRRAWRWLIRFSLAAVALWTSWELGRLYLNGNVHEVIPGRVYRGAQPSPESLERLIETRGIRTVLNVRGCCWPDEWYVGEAVVCQRRGVNLEDVSFSAVHLPSRHEVRMLIEVLDRTDYPIFMHCRHGSDRTGIAAMIAQLLLDEHSYAQAHRQLSLRYGHMPIGKTTMLDRFVKLYADWLADEGAEHSPSQFRRWAIEEYRGGWCDARFEKVERLFETPRVGEALAYNVVVRNTGSGVWRLHPLRTAGHHITFKVVNEAQNVVHEGRAAMFSALVQPGEALEATMIVPPLRQAGYYRLMVDMIEEGHCWFHQTGSEPWEEEFTIRE